MVPTSSLENVSAPRAPRYGVCIGGRNSLFMCKFCVPSQPRQILLGSTTVINTSANVASGTVWQHLARRTARPHLQCSR